MLRIIIISFFIFNYAFAMEDFRGVKFDKAIDIDVISKKLGVNLRAAPTSKYGIKDTFMFIFDKSKGISLMGESRESVVVAQETSQGWKLRNVSFVFPKYSNEKFKELHEGLLKKYKQLKHFTKEESAKFNKGMGTTLVNQYDNAQVSLMIKNTNGSTSLILSYQGKEFAKKIRDNLNKPKNDGL